MDYKYVGSELELFKDARNWKSYWSSKITRYMYGDVLEVGCGIGSNIGLLKTETVLSYTALEPDQELLTHSNYLRKDVVCINGNISSLPVNETYDVIVYIDVLEHIEDDRRELSDASRRLRKNGLIIVLAPAYQFLFSKFDSAVGHYRRYSRARLVGICPVECQLSDSFYLDSVGTALSLAARFVLNSNMPTIRQIRFWDKWVIPISRVLDPFIMNKFGRSVICIFKKS